ncbi:hypothetical protein [uncultured Thiohalocapsa sp.]|uniref:hypothetical protein n=1 Tax=uncultured Thiohalocapsa sp. TaxID=768990 RepID=UPI0025EB1534|nr:hypothetical protein [uncultured Thiohalocapsa sp.]
MPRPSFMSYAIIMRLLTMSIVWLTLLVWVFNAYRAGCGVSAGVLALVAGAVFVAGSERSHLHRRALFNETTQHEGRLLRLAYNGLLINFRDSLVAVLLAVVLLASALTFAPQQWSLLFADLLLLTLLIPRLARGLGTEVRSAYRFAMARQWAVWISLLVLWLEAVMSLVLYPPADYTGMRWQEVVTYNLTVPDAACGVIETATRIFVTGQAIAIWAVQNGARVANDPTQSVMLWVGYSTLVGFTFLTALAYSRALIGVMGRPWELWGKLSAPAQSGPAVH